MTNLTDMTKANILAALADLDVTPPRKANLEVLRALYLANCAPAAPAPAAPAPAAPAIGTGLKIEKDRPEQNGIKRPSTGGKCRAVWDVMEALAQGNPGAVTAAQVKGAAEQHGWNPNNASIEFYQWRKFNGVTGRTR